MRIITNQICMLTVALLLLLSCKDESDKHYGRPDWLKGNAYTVLQEKKDYTIFLSAIDKTGFRDLIDGKGLCTVFAPNDEAFAAYLSECGYSSISEIPLSELKILVGQHIMQYTYNTNQLLDFQHMGSGAPELYPAGLNYKHETFAKNEVQQIIEPITKRTIKVYNKETYLPVFSTELFKTLKLSNAESDYHYFFPKSKWYGNERKLYVANAGVLEDGIPTDNGYLYPIDAVIHPLQTVYKVIENHSDDFSTFLSLYNRFADVRYDSKITEKYAAEGDSLFLFYHKELPKIASEWTYNDENPGSTYIYKLTSRAFNAFVPSNSAMQTYLTTFFENNYTSYDEIPLLTLFYLAQNHVKLSDIVFPDNIRQGESSIFGDRYDFNLGQDVIYKEMCSNGVFYGVNKVVSPAMFRSVTGPVFKSNSYSIFAYILHKATELTQLINLDTEYTLFIPTDEIFEEAYSLRMNYGNGTFGNEKLEIMVDEKWVTCPDYTIHNLAQQHIIFETITDFTTPKIYRTKGDFTYVIVGEDGVRGEGSSVAIPTKTWNAANAGITNGVTYEVESVLSKSEVDIVQTLKNSSDFTTFYAKLVESGLIDTQGVLSLILAGDNVVVFAPTNAALMGVTLPTNKQQLADYLSYFFVSTSTNNMSDYVLPGFKLDGNYQTTAIDRVNSTIYETVYHKIGITDLQNKLKVTTKAGMSVTTIEGFPLFASNGAIYYINNVIQP